MAIPVSWRRAWALWLVLLSCTGISVGASGDPPETTFHTSVHEVRLTFSAVDRNHHGVATLQASDFAVVDKDIIVRSFQSFSRSERTKLDLAILIDTSESVTPRFHQEIDDMLALISQTAGVPDENLSIFSFRGEQPALLCAGDCRATHFAADRLPAARAGGLTPLFDSIIVASDFLSQHGDPHAQKVLILFSDGEDTVSRNSLARAINAALTDEIQIYSIDLNRPGSASQGAAVLDRLSVVSGGRYFSTQDGARRALNALLEGLQATYTVSYRLPSAASGFHTVRILPTHNLNLEFRSRSGYFYPNRVR